MARLSKDDKLIKDNPDATPYQLLELGLSESRYNELVEKAEKDIKSPIQKTPEEKINNVETTTAQKPVVRAIPKITASAPIMTGSGGMAYLVDKTGKAKPLLCKREIAEKWARKYPNEFQVK